MLLQNEFLSIISYSNIVWFLQEETGKTWFYYRVPTIYRKKNNTNNIKQNGSRRNCQVWISGYRRMLRLCFWGCPNWNPVPPFRKPGHARLYESTRRPSYGPLSWSPQYPKCYHEGQSGGRGLFQCQAGGGRLVSLWKVVQSFVCNVQASVWVIESKKSAYSK